MDELQIPPKSIAVYHATELDKMANAALQTVKAANLVERVGIMETEMKEMQEHIKKLEGRLVTYVVLEKEGE
jgi:tRNA1(Val) A37 N6-methylase TrmN6